MEERHEIGRSKSKDLRFTVTQHRTTFYIFVRSNGMIISDLASD